MNIREKQVILSKVEYDEMEQELNALKETVKSKTVTAIFKNNSYDTTKQHYIGMWSIPIGTQIEYVMGVDENEIVKDMSEEITKLRKENEEQQQQVQKLRSDYLKLKYEGESWKNLLWYKRLFVK
jgi:hypothetical protein